MLKLFNVSSTIHFVSRSILIFNPFPQPHYQTSRFKPVPQQHQKPIKNSQHPSARFFCIFKKTTYTQTNLPNSKSHGAPFHWIHPHHDDFSLHDFDSLPQIFEIPGAGHASACRSVLSRVTRACPVQ